MLAGALGGVLIFTNSRHQQENKASVGTVNQPLLTSGTGPEGAGTVKPNRPPTVVRALGAQPPAPTQAGSAVPPPRPTGVTSDPSSSGDGDMKQSQALAAEADKQYSDGDYCQALSTLDKAIELYRDQKYIRKRPTFVNGCNSQ
jgi:hypothetical protein